MFQECCPDVARIIRHGPIFDYFLRDPYETYEIGPEPDFYDYPEETMLVYLDKTVALCKENNISLILVSQPGNFMRNETHHYLCNYAGENEIEYINLCETSQYNAINAIAPKEDILGHSNIWGAQKITNYIGTILQEKYNIASVTDEQYESTKEFYAHILKNGELTHTTDINEYLEAIKDPNYTVFITSCDDAATGLSKETLSSLSSLGLTYSLEGKIRYAYAAVISPENGVTEAISEDEPVTLTGNIRNSSTIYSITGSSTQRTPYSDRDTITIDGTNYSKQLRGLNFVIYDNTLMKVIDSINFDTFSDSHASR